VVTPPSPSGEGLKSDDRPVTLAAIAGAHGVRGEVRLKLFGEGADSLSAYKQFHVGDRLLTLRSIRPANQGAVAQFAEIKDRSGAEAMRGTLLTVPRSALPPLGEGEYYHHDLIGLACVSTDGVALGHVVAVDNFGAGDLLEIERPAMAGKKPQRFMVPLTVLAVPSWDGDGVTINADFVED
jgi:16S rRNA processing protein RimM